MSKVYLETSFFSACVSSRTSEKSMGWRAVTNEWWQTEAGKHELFISDEVIRELSAPEFVNGPKALEMLRGLNLLESSAEAEELAALLVGQRVMPTPSGAGDAMHVAIATIHRMEYILTWNIKHLANPRKREHFAIICMKLSLAAPMIVTPDMLQESES